jgi:hypothetical protein
MAHKLFIFAIGGTGSRVVKALTMLLASGVTLGETSVVVPIIVDPHKANDDLKRTEDLLKIYQRIRNDLTQKPGPGAFFGQDIRTLKNIINNSDKLADTYTFELKGVGNETFGQYIDYAQLDPANKALTELLFSERNLNTEMNIGFVGNPNIGEFRQFAANFAANDRVFIISSIFGGTGAAGFPIILKNIRGATAGDLDNPEYLRNARIGALTALPYFGIEPNAERRIDKATFYSKAKAALHYYGRGVNDRLNRLYYIGDQTTQNYSYDPGEGGQRNDAHVVELAAALAIADFANLADADLDTENGKPVGPVFSEFGIRKNVETLAMADLGEETRTTLARPLTKMALLSSYISHQMREASGSMAWTKEAPAIDSSFLGGSFYKTYLGDFSRAFTVWLGEMSRNKRGFAPFALEGNTKAGENPALQNVVVGRDLAHLLAGYSPKGGFFAGKTDFNALENLLNKLTKGKTYPSPADKLMQAFGSSSDAFLSEKFPDLFKNA